MEDHTAYVVMPRMFNDTVSAAEIMKS